MTHYVQDEVLKNDLGAKLCLVVWIGLVRIKLPARELLSCHRVQGHHIA